MLSVRITFECLMMILELMSLIITVSIGIHGATREIVTLN